VPLLLGGLIFSVMLIWQKGTAAVLELADDSVRVATFNGQTVLPLSRAEQGELHGHRHHLPGITNSKSERYAEIGADRLRKRLQALCGSFALDR
jgi:hypothetical protein